MLDTDQKSITNLYELNKCTEIKSKINRDDLIRDDRKDKTYDFQKFKTILYFGRVRSCT